MRLTNKCPTRSLAIFCFALPAQVVKLVDTLASGASARKGVEVQVLSWAPNFLPNPRVLRNRAHRSFCVKDDYSSFAPAVHDIRRSVSLARGGGIKKMNGRHAWRQVT